MKYYSENEVISILINTCKELCKDKIYKPETYMTFREKIDERPSIELPNIHGDLLDKKDVIRVLFHAVEDVGPISDWTELMAILDDIPVVVEASE